MSRTDKFTLIVLVLGSVWFMVELTSMRNKLEAALEQYKATNTTVVAE